MKDEMIFDLVLNFLKEQYGEDFVEVTGDTIYVTEEDSCNGYTVTLGMMN